MTCQAPWRLMRLFFHEVTRRLNTLHGHCSGEGSSADTTKEIQVFQLKSDTWIKQLETAFLSQRWPAATRNGITGFKNEKIYSKRKSQVSERKKYTISVWGCLWSTSFRAKPEWSSICPAGMVHIFTTCKRWKQNLTNKKSISWDSKDEFTKHKAILNFWHVLLHLHERPEINTGATVYDVKLDSWGTKTSGLYTRTCRVWLFHKCHLPILTCRMLQTSCRPVTLHFGS